MAVPQPGVWGIDLGQCALKAIRLEHKDGQVVATAFDYIEHPKILSQPDADPDQLTREALEQFLSRNSLKGDTVVISVPGQSGLARFVKLPPVEEKKIHEIVKFEAKQQIPFPLEEVVWDYQKLGSGEVADGYALETEIGLFAMKRDMVNRVLQHFKDVSVEVHIIQMAPLALCNFIAFDQLGKSPGDAADESAGKNCVVALDIGTDNSSLVITDGGKIIWQRPIPIGGNHFTRALTKDLKLTFAKAEHVKRNAAKSPELKKILASLKSVLNDFVGEVQRSLGYFTNTHRDATIQYMVGLGNAFRLPGLKQFLQEKLQLEVRKLSKFERMTGDGVTAAPAFAENIMSFGVAYGLSLQGLKQTRLLTNLLPHEVRMERLIRGKKPWAVAAAAALVVAVAGLAFSKNIENQGVQGADIDIALAKGKDVQKQAADNKAAFEAELKRRKEAEENVNRISAGVKERFNWQLLHQYINMALPMSNGGRLAEVSRKREAVKDIYWSNDKLAQNAFTMLEERRFRKEGEATDKMKALKIDEEIKKHLIQINVSGISALYSDDLSLYFKKIFAEGESLRGMADTERKLVADIANGKELDEAAKAKVPKAGWVVEIRGYSYHKGGQKFVENTLIENLHLPEYLRGPGGSELKEPPADKKDLDKIVRENISFLYFNTFQTVKDPEPGKFVHIDKSRVKGLIQGEGQQGGGFGGGVPAPGIVQPGGPAPGKEPAVPFGGEAANAAAAGPSRDGWRSIGEITSRALGEGGGGGFGGFAGGFGGGAPGGDKGGFAPPAIPNVPMGGDSPLFPGGVGAKKGAAGTMVRTPRYEFVLLFVWKEPQSIQDATATAAVPAVEDAGKKGP